MQPRGFVCLVLALFASGILARADLTIFHLCNGDRITGEVLVETTLEVTITTPFAGRLTLPIDQIERREKEAASAAPPTTAAPPAPPVSAATGAPGPATNTAAVIKTPAPTKAPATNPPPALKQFFSTWTGDAQVGLNLGFSTKNHQAYTGRFKAVHAPTSTLRNSLDYLASYGTSDGVLSENQMDGIWRLERDIGGGKRFLIYNLTGAGYNEIQKIDLRYEIGPGVGYKWITRTNLLLKSEFGANYQRQHFSTGDDQTRYSLRLAEESSWQLTGRLKFDQRFEFFPEVEDPTDYRLRAEGNLSYLLRNNLTLSLSVIDLYDTTPAAGASNNDLQIRSLLGIKF